MRKLTGHAAKTKCSLIFINQTRQKIGVTFGSPETTTGGNALKFYCSVRMDIRRIGAVKEGETAIGNRVRAKVVKNKLAPPFKEAEFEILYGRGISATGEVLDTALERGVVSKSGAWYALGELRLGQGREKARSYLEEHPGLMTELRTALAQDELDARAVAERLGAAAQDTPTGTSAKDKETGKKDESKKAA
jgi:recombination protein RecA